MPDDDMFDDADVVDDDPDTQSDVDGLVIDVDDEDVVDTSPDTQSDVTGLPFGKTGSSPIVSQ
jgi:hypothetical protein